MADRNQPNLAAFIAAQTSFFPGHRQWPGSAHPASRRAGGFLRVLDSKTLGFADYRGNRRYISQDNLGESPIISS